MPKSTFPPIPLALLVELEKRFPDRMPETDDSVDAIRVKQGSVKVTRFLRSQFDLQNKSVLEN
jgi:hypothetical protein